MMIIHCANLKIETIAMCSNKLLLSYCIFIIIVNIDILIYKFNYTINKIYSCLINYIKFIPPVRVNKRLKRLRLNQRLRKTLQPKNAIMVLNEMKPGVQFTFPETQGPMPNSLYLVHAEVFRII